MPPSSISWICSAFHVAAVPLQCMMATVCCTNKTFFRIRSATSFMLLSLGNEKTSERVPPHHRRKWHAIRGSSPALRNIYDPQSSKSRLWVAALVVAVYVLHSEFQRFGYWNPGAGSNLCGVGRLAEAWAPLSPASAKLSRNPTCKRSTAANNDFSTPPKSEDRITIAIIYYQSPTLLAQWLEAINLWPRELQQYFEILIIDDASRVGQRVQDVTQTAPTAIRQTELFQQRMHVYYIHQDLDWNIGGARNLAMHVAATDYVLLSDIDVTIPPTVLPFLLQLWDTDKKTPTQDTMIHKFRRVSDDGLKIRPHPGILFCKTPTYWRAGGYDEDFVGNYGSDTHFRHRSKYTPGLTILAAWPLMEEDNIAPLVEIVEGSDICPQSFRQCGTPMPWWRRKRKAAKYVHINAKLFDKKRKDLVQWSNDYLRFEWSKVENL